jgi:hypothetical protein
MTARRSATRPSSPTRRRSDEGYKELDLLLSKQRSDARVSRMRERGQGMWADRYQAAEDSLAEYRKNDDPTADPVQRANQLQAEKAKVRALMAGDAQERVAQTVLVGGQPVQAVSQPAQTGGQRGRPPLRRIRPRSSTR